MPAIEVLPWLVAPNIRRISFVAVLGLAFGCRQPNPDWQGPASADAAGVTTNDVMTSAASVADGTTGAMCQVDGDCAEPTPVCFEGTCVAAGEGLPCQSNATCPAVAPLCNPDGQCQDGNEGDPCDTLGQTDCSDEAPHCVDGQCSDGSPGDPCTGEGECMSGTCTDGMCE